MGFRNQSHALAKTNGVSVGFTSMDQSLSQSCDFAKEFAIPSDPAEIHRLQQMVVDQLAASRYGEQDIFGIKLALEEALVNAMKHGNQLDRSKSVRVRLRISDRRFYIRIRDEGAGFDPSCIPDPTIDANLERPCGRGLMLMRHYMSQVRFLDCGHTVVMWKRRNGR